MSTNSTKDSSGPQGGKYQFDLTPVPSDAPQQHQVLAWNLEKEKDISRDGFIGLYNNFPSTESLKYAQVQLMPEPLANDSIGTTVNACVAKNHNLSGHVCIQSFIKLLILITLQSYLQIDA